MESSQALEAKTIPAVTVVTEVLERGNKYAQNTNKYHPLYRYTVTVKASYGDHATTVTAPTIKTSHKRKQDEDGTLINTTTIDVDPFTEAQPEILSRESAMPSSLPVLHMGVIPPEIILHDSYYKNN
jgi:transaldolase